MPDGRTPALAPRVARVESVNVARARSVLIRGRSVLTAIHKLPVSDSVAVGLLGLEGDEQADLSVHGGPAKAVYLYPAEHLAWWDNECERAAGRDGTIAPARLGCGAMGENLTTRGLTEDQLWIGDELRLPQVVFVVSEPRYPCFKFNAAMGFALASRCMVEQANCGSYLAVREPGRVAAGDPITLVPGPREVRLQDVFRGRARA